MLSFLKAARITLCNDFSLHYPGISVVNEDRFHGVGMCQKYSCGNCKFLVNFLVKRPQIQKGFIAFSLHIESFFGSLS